MFLVAFRVLVCWLDQNAFFQHPVKVCEARAKSHLPEQLATLSRTRAPERARALAELVDAHLASLPDKPEPVAEFAFAIDAEFGLTLAKCLGIGDRSHMQIVARAVNTANRLLMGEGGAEKKPIILVRSPQRYWEQHQNVVSPFPRDLQDTPSSFRYLLPVTTQLSRVDYSAVGRVCAPKLTVALWPAEAPSMDSAAITRSAARNGIVPFRFTRWENLPPELQEPHTDLAARIAEYVCTAPDVVDTVHIAAAPELMLAPQCHDSITKAIATRRSAAWIVFPGSYHIERGEGVVNRAPIYVGGVLDQSDLTSDPGRGPVAAVKRIPVVIPGSGGDCVEDIDGSTCSVHLVDTNVGRIAVMICRDFLDPALRNEVVLMGTDHLFVLSMSPDHGTKFETAMDETSNFGTGSFLVNAFTGKSWRVGHRKPLKEAQAIWELPAGEGQHCALVLE
jgi:hypothetical protein